MDSQLLTSASVFIRDFLEPITGKKLSASSEKKVGKYMVATMIAMVTILALIPEMQKSIILLASKGAAVAFLLLPILILTLLGNKSTILAIGNLVLGIFIMLTIEISGIKIAYGFGSAIIALIGQTSFILIGLLIYRARSMVLKFSVSQN